MAINGEFLWPVYCSKAAKLHVIEAQERHEKSPKKLTTTQANVASLGDTSYVFDYLFNLSISILCFRLYHIAPDHLVISPLEQT